MNGRKRIGTSMNASRRRFRLDPLKPVPLSSNPMLLSCDVSTTPSYLAITSVASPAERQRHLLAVDHFLIHLQQQPHRQLSGLLAMC